MEEKTAQTTAEWVFVARSLVQLPGSEGQAIDCMRRAENEAESVTDWIDLASVWA